jgi:hypothetical protein
MARELRIDVGALDDELTLEEMGLDSLAAAEIVLAVEQTLDTPVDTWIVAASITRDTRLAEFVIAIDEAIDP